MSQNLEALINFLKQAQQDLAKKDYVCLKEDLKQALGRARNLQIEEEDRKKEASHE